MGKKESLYTDLAALPSFSGILAALYSSVHLLRRPSNR